MFIYNYIGYYKMYKKITYYDREKSNFASHHAKYHLDKRSTDNTKIGIKVDNY